MFFLVRAGVCSDNMRDVVNLHKQEQDEKAGEQFPTKELTMLCSMDSVKTYEFMNA